MSNNFHGAFGGVQAGYNRQINSNWILGVEADISNSGIKGSGSNPVFKVASFPSTFRESENIRWFGTVRGRIGYAPADGFMVYGTGGFAYGREDSNASMTVLPQIGVTNIGASIPPYSFSCALGQACFSGNSSRIATGWTVGAGFEQKLWKNVSLKAEYLYVDLGDSGQTNVVAQQTLNPTDIASSFTANHSSTNFNVVRVGLNVKLGD